MNNSFNHTFKKSGIYYFVRRVPKHLRDDYITDKISFSLKTRSETVATKRAQFFAKQLDDQWFIMGTNKDPIFSRYLATTTPSQSQDAVTLVTGEPQVLLTEASMAYRELKGAQKSKTFHASVERAVYSVL